MVLVMCEKVKVVKLKFITHCVMNSENNNNQDKGKIKLYFGIQIQRCLVNRQDFNKL